MSGPLSEPGYEIDPTTGFPKDLNEGDNQKAEEEHRVRKIVEESQNLINELGAGGGQLVKEMLAVYINRVNHLIANDEQCQVCEKLLSAIQHKVNVGEAIVRDKIKGLSLVAGRR